MKAAAGTYINHSREHVQIKFVHIIYKNSAIYEKVLVRMGDDYQLSLYQLRLCLIGTYVLESKSHMSMQN